MEETNNQTDIIVQPERGYDPNHLLDHLKHLLQIRRDVELAQVLGARPPTLSKLRHQRQLLSATLLISMHEVSGLSVSEMRHILGDRGKYFNSVALGKKLR